MKPRTIGIVAAIFLGSLALQMLMTRNAQSRPLVKNVSVKTASQAKKPTNKVAAKKVTAKKLTTKPAPLQKKIAAKPTPAMPIYNFKLQSLDGKPVDFSKYQGKTLLIVNTASKCGYTKQYAGLQALNQKYAGQGLAILGFPANNFGGQEPGSDAEIVEFCQKNYGVSFDMFSKVSVKGDDQAPIFKYLTTEANPDLKGDIGWNFEKFLVSSDGKLVARFKSGVAPDSTELTNALEAELAKK